MSDNAKKITSNKVFRDLLEELPYAIELLCASRDSLLESHIGKSFDGKPPRSVIMHAVSRALTSDLVPIDRTKFTRGVTALCLYLLEDEDVNLALKLKDDLSDIEEE